jgi:hypothetical protein
MNTYMAGELATVGVSFVQSDAPVDPGTVTLRWAAPLAATTTWIYGVASQVARASAGVYEADIDTTGMTPGTLIYEWQSTGAGQAINAGTLLIEATAL